MLPIVLRGNAVNFPAIRTVGITPDHGIRRAYEVLDRKVEWRRVF